MISLGGDNYCVPDEGLPSLVLRSEYISITARCSLESLVISASFYHSLLSLPIYTFRYLRVFLTKSLS
jgi:hypothetical protein